MLYTIGIIGSRSFYDRSVLDQIMKALFENYPILNDYDIVICSGGAKGADTLAQSYAKDNGMSILIHYPDWSQYGKKAGMVRNFKIAQISNLIIALWDGESTGTMHTLSILPEINPEAKYIKYNKQTGEIVTSYRGGLFK